MLKRSIAIVNTSNLELENASLRVHRKRLRREDTQVVTGTATWMAQSQNAAAIENISKRVHFCPLVQYKEIPSLCMMKDVLFYSRDDYQKFQDHERRRRETYVLTKKLVNEQKKRAIAGRNMIPSTRVMTMYHVILTHQEQQRQRRQETDCCQALEDIPLTRASLQPIAQRVVSARAA